MIKILVLYYSNHGSIAKMANLIARGIESIENCEAIIRTVDSDDDQNQNVPLATLNDLQTCDALALGSPSYFGNMAAPLKKFIDQLTDIWLSGKTIGKPATVFSSTGSLHGGQETTLISMMLPLFHLGFILIGVPYSEINLLNTTTGGTPYGATHVAGIKNNQSISNAEKQICLTVGKRLANLAKNLNK